MSDQNRPNPDALLAQLQEDESVAVRGRLRIYFGSSAGVGKTYAMLQAAHRRLRDGVRVLAGVIVTHGRSETQALVDGLPQLPLKLIEHRGRTFHEFDLDGALQRHPELVLVDELAHTNAPGSRHPKRWQDVEELLAAGISVYTTLNVQHLESLNDVVGGITGVRVQETLPDTFFDQADEVVMVDTPADELLARLKAGKVYMGPAAERAANHFFRKGNLMALRELALRRTADRVEDDVQAWRSKQRVVEVWKTEAAILCAIGPEPAAESVVRSAAQLAQQLNVSWHAVYVETPALQRLPDAQRERILRVVRLAHELGATTAVLQQQDPAAALAAHARAHNLSKLVLGRSAASWPWQRPLSQRLVSAAPELDQVMVAAASVAAPERQPERIDATPSGLLSYWRRYGLAVLACVLMTAINWPLQWYFAPANTVMLYLLSVVGVALLAGRGPAVLASFLGVGCFDYFFVDPRLSFAVSDMQYLLTFAVMLVVGLVTGQLTAGLRYQARVSAEREVRARALFNLTSDLNGALQVNQVVGVVEETLANEVEGRALLYVCDLQDNLQASPSEAALAEGDKPDIGTARWAYDQNRAAGLTTDTLPGSPWYYLPLKAAMRTRGVLALRPSSRRSVLLPELREQIETYGRIIAQALERVHYVEVAQQALVHIESERLRNSLLAALSHDLRTPLSVVYGMAQTLAARPGLDADAHELALTLSQQARRITSMVNNLLDMAKLQSGAVRLNRQWQPLDEVVGTALHAMTHTLAQHPVELDLPADLPLLHLDAALMDRVLCNLLENAVKYTPPGSRIRISARVVGEHVRLDVADNGPGFAPQQMDRLFDKFTRGERESSTPGIGLGLAICRAIVEAHGGRIWAESPPGGGACFCIELPLGQPPALPQPEPTPTSTTALTHTEPT